MKKRRVIAIVCLSLLALLAGSVVAVCSAILLAQALGLHPVDAVLHLTDTDDLMTTAFFFTMSEQNMWKILAQPYVMFGSDASLRAPQGQLSRDHPHPRAYGTFARLLGKDVRDEKVISLQEAVRRRTSPPRIRLKPIRHAPGPPSGALRLLPRPCTS